jgi:cytoskeletal protein RodZ
MQDQLNPQTPTNKKPSWKEKLRPKTLIYPAISILFIVIGLFLFFWLIKFISTSINKPFSITDESVAEQVLKVNQDDLNQIKDRLNLDSTNIKTSQPSETSEPPTNSETTPELTESLDTAPPTEINQTENKQDQANEPTQTEPSKPENLKNLKIQILNGTKTTGIAGKLKTALESAGFTNITTGNGTATATTTIQITSTVSTDFPISIKTLEDTVKQNYKPSPTQISNDLTADIIITIGAE